MMIFHLKEKMKKFSHLVLPIWNKHPPLIITASNKRCTSLFQNLIGARERLKEEYDNCGS